MASHSPKHLFPPQTDQTLETHLPIPADLSSPSTPYRPVPVTSCSSPYRFPRPIPLPSDYRTVEKPRKGSGPEQEREDDVIEVEEYLSWIQDKAVDLVEFTGFVTQAIPGPRVGSSSLPWILAVPLAYVSVSFVIAVVKTVRKFGSPREKRRRLVNKNAVLCKSVDELFKTGTDAVQPAALIELSKKTGFGMEEILRKYIHYALNEKQFNPRWVSDLILLRKASMLEDSQITDILNDISRHIIQDKEI